MSAPPEEEEPDWIDTLVDLAGKLGFSEIRVRWKLISWVQAWEGRKLRSQAELEHALYENTICPFCGGLNEGGEVSCHLCRETLPSHRWQVLARFGLVSPIGWTVSSLFATLALLAYAHNAWAGGGGGVHIAFEQLIRGGAGYGHLVRFGDSWRLLTAPFLHLGLARLFVGLVGILQVGPLLERRFGRGRVLLLAFVVGILSQMGHIWSGAEGLYAGLMPMVFGLGAFGVAWGHREGTLPGTELREALVRWMVGLFVVQHWFVPYFDRIGSANWAWMIWGIGTGLVLGYLVPVAAMDRRSGGDAGKIAAVFGAVGFLATAYFLVMPPAMSALATQLIDSFGG